MTGDSMTNQVSSECIRKTVAKKIAEYMQIPCEKVQNREQDFNKDGNCIHLDAY